MENNFGKIILPHILEAEGGFVNHVNDRGGATNMGITLQTYSSYLGRPASVAELKKIPRAHVNEIYSTNYYKAMGLDKVKSGEVAMVLMDQGVNRGTRRVVKQAQMVANEQFNKKLAVDGQFGPKTAKAINSIDAIDYSREFLQLSTHVYVDIVKRRMDQMVFLSGWMNRVHRVEDIIFTGKSSGGATPVPKPDDQVIVSDSTPFDWAKGEINTREIKGRKHNPRILWYHSFTDLGAKTDEVAWCSSFMCAAHEVNGLPSTDSALARSWLKYGEAATGQVGDIVIFKRGKSSWQGHVGFVARPYKKGDRYIYTLGGNQKNMVCIKPYLASKLLGFRTAA